MQIHNSSDETSNKAQYLRAVESFHNHFQRHAVPPQQSPYGCSSIPNSRELSTEFSSKRNVVNDVFLAFVAKVFPPAPVFIKTGISKDLLINTGLTMFGVFPGALHAWYVILKNPGNREWEVNHHNGFFDCPTSNSGYARPSENIQTNVPEQRHSSTTPAETPYPGQFGHTYEQELPKYAEMEKDECTCDARFSDMSDYEKRNMF